MKTQRFFLPAALAALMLAAAGCSDEPDSKGKADTGERPQGEAMAPDQAAAYVIETADMLAEMVATDPETRALAEMLQRLRQMYGAEPTDGAKNVYELIDSVYGPIRYTVSRSGDGGTLGETFDGIRVELIVPAEVKGVLTARGYDVLTSATKLKVSDNGRRLAMNSSTAGAGLEIESSADIAKAGSRFDDVVSLDGKRAVMTSGTLKGADATVDCNILDRVRLAATMKLSRELMGAMSASYGSEAECEAAVKALNAAVSGDIMLGGAGVPSAILIFVPLGAENVYRPVATVKFAAGTICDEATLQAILTRAAARWPQLLSRCLSGV